MILLKKDDRKKYRHMLWGGSSTWLVYRNRSTYFQVAISNVPLAGKQREGKERGKGRVVEKERSGEGNTR